MKDPYLVLGVSRDATNDEIKKAYRALCRKYHPDVNRDNPNRDEYKQRFTEVGEAYQAIMDERSGKKANYSGYSDYSGSSSSANSDSHIRAASVYIQRGYFKEALNILNSMTDRPSMWYYLSAVANARIGNLIIAREHAKSAVCMEPGNLMYQRLYSSLSGNGGFYEDYTQTGTSYGRQFNIDSDYCLKCCAANIALNICCGSRFFCC